jgi:hypothetical protein
MIDGAEYYAGNLKLIADLNLTFDEKTILEQTSQGKTPVILAQKSCARYCLL